MPHRGHRAARAPVDDVVRDDPDTLVIDHAGEVLFVPGGTPHAVENLTDSLAYAGNFVDDSNLSNVLEEMRWLAMRDKQVGEALAALEEMDAEARQISAEAADFADASPLPDPSALYQNVWAEINPNGRLFFDGRPESEEAS